MRNYVLNPYQIVKDLRTGYEIGNPQAVFDGDIDGFLEAGIRWRRGAERARPRTSRLRAAHSAWTAPQRSGADALRATHGERVLPVRQLRRDACPRPHGERLDQLAALSKTRTR